MKTITCIVNHGKNWTKGDGFAADSVRWEWTPTGMKLVGKDIDGKSFRLPASKLTVDGRRVG